MMYPPCCVVTGTLLPELRMRVTRYLEQEGYSQTKISHFLHVSQAMVSKYLSQPPIPLSDLLPVAGRRNDLHPAWLHPLCCMYPAEESPYYGRKTTGD